MTPAERKMSDVLGPWERSASESSLVERCRLAWEKPFGCLSNHEMATFLNQRFAVEDLLPLAKKRIQDRFDDDTELYDGHLASAIEEAEYWYKVDQEHRRIIANRYSKDEKQA